MGRVEENIEPDVSVIIPARNAVKTIGDAIASVLGQLEIDKFEIIVVDDGSTDGTPMYISKAYPSVKVFSTRGKGVSAARNLGLVHCKGRYVAFLDSDDMWKEGKLDYQICYLKHHPDYVLSGSGADYIDGSGRIIRKKMKHFDGVATHALLKGNFIVTSSVVIPRSVFEQAQLSFNEAMVFGEDWQLWIRLSLYGKFNVTSTPFVRYTCYPARKYDQEFMTQSLAKMVETLKHDPKILLALGANKEALDIIPEAARLNWLRHTKGFGAWILGAVRLFKRYPRGLFRIIRSLS